MAAVSAMLGGLFAQRLPAQTVPPADAFQVRYAANLNIGDSYIDITNAGSSGGNICVNVYTFSPDEAIDFLLRLSGTPDGLVSLSARHLLSVREFSRRKNGWRDHRRCSGEQCEPLLELH